MIQNDKSYRIKIGNYLKTGPYETESERGGSVYADCRGFRGGSEYRPGNSETVSATGLEGVCGTVLHGAARKYPQQLTLVPLDVSDKESVDAAAKIVAEKADRVDLLMHNAAVFGGGRDEAAVLRLLGGRCGQRCAQRGSFQLLYVQDRAEHGAAADVQSVAADGIFLPTVPPRLGTLA